MTIRELIHEQRQRVRSSNLAERFAAALLIPAALTKQLREVSDISLGHLLEHEVCANMNLLSPELTVCAEAVHRLERSTRIAMYARPRRVKTRFQEEGEHVLHAETALYRAGVPFLQLPWQVSRFASSTFMVSNVANAKSCLLQAGFRETSLDATVLIHQTKKPIRLYEDKTRLYSRNEEEHRR